MASESLPPNHGILVTKDYIHFKILYKSSRSVIGTQPESFEFNGAEKARGCLPGDKVAWNTKKNCVELISVAEHGRIVGILELTSKTRYGLTSRGYPIFLFRPFDSAYPPFIVGSSQKNLTHNQLCSILYKDYWRADTTFPRGEIAEYFGYVGDWRAERAALLARWCPNKAARIDKATLEQYQLSTEYFANRIDLANKSSVTFHIDPEGCRDVDDIITVCDWDSCSENSHQSFDFIITIADVGAWIEPDSNIATAAYSIGQTFYDENGKALRPMLQNILSEDLLSLKNYGENGFTYTYKLGISYVLKIKQNKLGQSEISHEHSKLILSKIKKSDIHTYTYDNFIENLSQHTHENTQQNKSILSRTLLAYLAIERELGRPGNKYSGIAGTDVHAFIESCMLVFNKKVGYFLATEGLSGQTLYRVQDEQDTERIAKWAEIGQILGDSSDFSWLGNKAARYALGNLDGVRHAGLGLNYYTHSSSPIRRFADLWNQWLLHSVLEKKLIPELAIFPIEDLVENINERAKASKRFGRELAIIAALEGGMRVFEGICLEWRIKSGQNNQDQSQDQDRNKKKWRGYFWIPAWKEIAVVRQLPDRIRPNPGERCHIHCGINWVCGSWKERFVLEVV